MEIVLKLMPWIWGLITLICSLITLKVKDLDALWFIISSFISFVISLIFPKLSLLWQLSIFIVTTLILLLTIGRIVKRRLRDKNISINSDSLVGKEISILEDCSEFDKGSGNIDDVVWTTICPTGHSLKKGDIGVVIAIEGNKLIVKEK